MLRLQGLSQPAILRKQASPHSDLLDPVKQLVEIDRLEKIVRSSGLDSCNRGFYRAVSGDDDNRSLGMDRSNDFFYRGSTGG
jgi:hypothetical protein